MSFQTVFAAARKTRAESQSLKLRAVELRGQSKALRLIHVRLRAQLNANSRQSRIHQGEYFADMLELGEGPHPFWYILRHRGSDATLDQMNFNSYEESLKAARKALANFNEALGERSFAMVTISSGLIQ